MNSLSAEQFGDAKQFYLILQYTLAHIYKIFETKYYKIDRIREAEEIFFQLNVKNTYIYVDD